MPAKKFCLNADNEVLKKQFEEDNFVVEMTDALFFSPEMGCIFLMKKRYLSRKFCKMIIMNGGE